MTNIPDKELQRIHNDANVFLDEQHKHRVADMHDMYSYISGATAEYTAASKREREFIEWLDERINANEDLMDKENRKMEPDQYYYGAWQVLEAAKEKFISLQSQTTQP